MPLSGFDRFEFRDGGIEHEVFRGGKGPAVILMHELPGMTPECIALADRLVARGFTVYLPLLFGKPGVTATTSNLLRLCIRREFRLLAKKDSGPITGWLRALARQAHVECRGKGVGAIGMCLTGGFALALMLEPATLAAVACQPSLPLGLGAARKRALGLTAGELAAAKERAAAGVVPLCLRFTGDPISPPQRLERLREEFGAALEVIEINSSPGNSHGLPSAAHSTLTAEYKDDPAHPTWQALERVVAVLGERLR